MKFAIRIRFKGYDNNKWHRHSTKWYNNLDDAWIEADKFQAINSSIISECSCSAVHKEDNR